MQQLTIRFNAEQHETDEPQAAADGFTLLKTEPEPKNTKNHLTNIQTRLNLPDSAAVSNSSGQSAHKRSKKTHCTS